MKTSSFKVPSLLLQSSRYFNVEFEMRNKRKSIAFFQLYHLLTLSPSSNPI
jgi:hypothetical protein